MQCTTHIVYILYLTVLCPQKSLNSPPPLKVGGKNCWIKRSDMILKAYTIRSIVCKASCQPVTWSLGHLVTWSLGHLVTRSLGHVVTRSTRSPGHPVIRSLGHSVTLSLGHSVIQSLGNSIFNMATDELTDNIRTYRCASQTNTEFQCGSI